MPSPKFMAVYQGLDKKRRGEWEWTRCPLPHNHKNGDKNPSCSIRLQPNGKAQVRCWAGCDTEEVLRAWNLTFADL